MSFLEGFYFVQRSRSDGGRGWESFWVTRDPGIAEDLAGSQERAAYWVHGEAVTQGGVTITRVRIIDEILEESGVDGLLDAIAATRVQLQEIFDAERASEASKPARKLRMSRFSLRGIGRPTTAPLTQTTPGPHEQTT